MSFLARRAFAATQRAAATTPLATTTPARAFSASARREIAKITLVGNLAAQPELKTTGTGREVIEYSVASSTGSGDNRRTSWFRVSAFTDGEARRNFITSLPKGYVVFFNLLCCYYCWCCYCCHWSPPPSPLSRAIFFILTLKEKEREALEDTQSHGSMMRWSGLGRGRADERERRSRDNEYGMCALNQLAT